jgi:hypothetical protein
MNPANAIITLLQARSNARGVSGDRVVRLNVEQPPSMPDKPRL